MSRNSNTTPDFAQWVRLRKPASAACPAPPLSPPAQPRAPRASASLGAVSAGPACKPSVRPDSELDDRVVEVELVGVLDVLCHGVDHAHAWVFRQLRRVVLSELLIGVEMRAVVAHAQDERAVLRHDAQVDAVRLAVKEPRADDVGSGLLNAVSQGIGSVTACAVTGTEGEHRLGEGGYLADASDGSFEYVAAGNPEAVGQELEVIDGSRETADSHHRHDDDDNEDRALGDGNGNPYAQGAKRIPSAYEIETMKRRLRQVKATAASLTRWMPYR